MRRKQISVETQITKATHSLWPITLQHNKSSLCTLGCVCRGRGGGGTLSHKLYNYVQSHSGRVFAPFWSENGYTLCPCILVWLNRVSFSREVDERIHRFNLQMSKKEREIWINNMDKRKLCCRPFPHTSLRIHSHCATESWRAYL